MYKTIGLLALHILLFLSLSCSKSYGSHIVGGEIEVVYSGTGYFYNIYLNMYYDDLHAEDGLFNMDQAINVSIFSKATNLRQKNIQLRRVSTDIINNTNNGCNNQAILKNRKFRYESLKSDGTRGPVDLSGLFEPQGYYIAWERCCRNYETINIIHENFWGTKISGQTFYAELPPVQKSGIQFINSTPIFTPIVSQFLCKNNFIYLDFSAYDLDGDSLSYRLATPLQGHTTDNNSMPTYPYSAPYDSITWTTGYNYFNAIPGNPALNINYKTGIMGVNPAMNGLFAFAVVCSEFRNGIKIGEVRRDYQFLVAGCPPAYPPSVGINSNPNSTNWGTTQPDTLMVKLNKDTCFAIFVTDSSANFYNTNDNLSISYGATNLPPTVLSFNPTRVFVTPTQDTTSMNMCFSTCDKLLIEKDSIYFLDIIVRDGDEGTCNRKSDTLRTYVYVDVNEGNSKPQIGTTLATNAFVTYTDSLTEFFVYGKDNDFFDLKTIEAIPFRFDMEEYRMQFEKVFENSDSIAYKFSWTPKCFDWYKKKDFKITFLLKDKSCIYTHTDTVSVEFNLFENQTELMNIIPSNLITPNNDGLNDCFHIPNMPLDNCTHFFKSIKIYNRWGNRIYYNEDRNFNWCPENDFSDGIYYYSIDLNLTKIKGWIQIIDSK